MDKVYKGLLLGIILTAAFFVAPRTTQAEVRIQKDFGKGLRSKLSSVNYDQNRDGILSEKELKKIETVNLNQNNFLLGENLYLRGLSKLKYLKQVKIISNGEGGNVYGLNELRKLKKLESIYIQTVPDKKSRLNLKGLKNLSFLYIGTKKMTLTLGKENKIKKIYLYGVKNGAAEILKCRKAEQICVGGSKIETAIHLKKMKWLSSISLSASKNIKSIHIERCSKLYSVELNTVNVKGEVRIHDCEGLEDLAIYDGSMASLSCANGLVSGSLSISYVRRLKSLYVADMEEISILSITHLPELEKLTLKNLTDLRFLRCEYTSLSEFAIFGQNSITDVWITHSKLKKFDLSNLESLSQLKIDHNELEGRLDIPPYVNLENINCSYNQLTEIYITTSIWKSIMLDCRCNKLKLIASWWTNRGNGKLAILCKNNPNVTIYANAYMCMCDADAKIYTETLPERQAS